MSLLIRIKKFFAKKCEDCGRPIGEKMEVRLFKRDGTTGILCQDCACPRLGHRDMLAIIRAQGGVTDPSHECDITKLKSHTYETFKRSFAPPIHVIQGFSSLGRDVLYHIPGCTPAKISDEPFSNKFAAQEAAEWFNVWLKEEPQHKDPNAVKEWMDWRPESEEDTNA